MKRNKKGKWSTVILNQVKNFANTFQNAVNPFDVITVQP